MPLVMVRGGGDLGSGAAHRLFLAGCRVVVLEQAAPTLIRHSVSFGTAIFTGEIEIEGVVGRRVSSAASVAAAAGVGEIPVLVDPDAGSRLLLKPDALVDAILAKKRGTTRISHAPIVIALGPGFTAGVDAHAVIETMRGHDLGRAIYQGRARPDSGQPAEIAGEGPARVLRAPASGPLLTERRVGERVAKGDTIGLVAGKPVVAGASGVIRGLLWPGVEADEGMKVGDIDPRGDAGHVDRISDKARAVAGGVLEALLHYRGKWTGRDGS